MAIINSILTLYERGWSRRRIARELGLNRETVGRHLRLGKEAGGSKPAISPPGSAPCLTAGRRSQCLGHESEISAKLEAGLSAQRIWQDLVVEVAFGGSYQSIKRFVGRIKARRPERIWRIEVLPGEEAQVDFCTGWWLQDEHGGKRKVHVLRVTLSYSRKAYSEGVLRQDTESFLRAQENAFRHFGGAPATVCLDNLKAGVLQAHWYDPEVNPKLAEFARFYGTVILPTRPRTPQHKGKVENAVGYVENNALKGRSFESLGALNAFLSHWEKSIADLRIHGTTRKQVNAHFLESEKPRLKALPSMIFPFFHEGQRQAHRDSYVEVEGSFYEAPPEYIGLPLWVRWDSHMVRVFNSKMELLASHARVQPGRFSRTLGAQGRPCASIEESYRYYTEKAARLGVHVAAWAEALVEQRGPQAIRVLQGLLALSKRHASPAIDQACGKALELSQWRLKELTHWLQNPAPQQKILSFLETHPLIRDPMEYGRYVGAWEEQPQTQPQTT